MSSTALAPDRLTTLNDAPSAGRFLRWLWRASNAVCWLCGKDVPLSQATVDHVIPRSAGGSDHVRNLRLACFPCNQARGDRFASKVPPFIDYRGAPSYNPTAGSRLTVARLYAREGGVCWLCQGHVPVRDAVRCRVNPAGPLNSANLRIAHDRCQNARNATLQRVALGRRYTALERRLWVAWLRR